MTPAYPIGSGGRRWPERRARAFSIRRKAKKAATAPDKPKQPRKSRKGAKQATLIAMLRQPEGATIEQIGEATGWQKHSVRSAISGALKKKLGLTVTSEKSEGGIRVYRIPA